MIFSKSVGILEILLPSPMKYPLVETFPVASPATFASLNVAFLVTVSLLATDTLSETVKSPYICTFAFADVSGVRTTPDASFCVYPIINSRS